jgi:signal transduction histidine kinase
MSFIRSLPQFFRSLEWILLIAHLGMMLSGSGYNLFILFASCAILFGLSWIFPLHHPRWQRLSYVAIGTITVLAAGVFGINLGLFLQVYAGKSYILSGKRTAIAVVALTAIPWTINEYARESRLAILSQTAIDPIRFAIVTLAIYAAASFFTLMLSHMIIVQQKKDQQIAALTAQVESLAANLERTRIAREIHDSLGHTLTDLDTQLAVAQTLRSSNPDQAFAAIDTAKQLSRQCIEDVSQALSRMRKSDFDLDQALAALREQLRQSSTLKVDWKVNLPTLPIAQSYQIYCVIKEALFNVQKHAKASHIQFSTHQTNQGITINIIDDGIGFDSDIVTPGFGLQGIIERTQLLGGQFDLQTKPGQGTQIRITIPL